MRTSLARLKKCLSLMLLLAVLLAGVLRPAQTYAATGGCSPGMSQLDCAALLGNWANWIPDTCSQGGDVSQADANLQGSDNMQKAFNYFVGKGLSALTAAAIVGNFVQESHVNPSEGGGYMAQWGGVRLTNLNKFADEQGKPVTSLSLQLDFVATELRILQPPQDIPVGDYSSSLNSTKQQTDIAAATGYFMGTYPIAQYALMGGEADQATIDFINQYGDHPGYEGPSLPALGSRINDAKQILSMYGNGQAADSSTPTETTDTSDGCPSGEGSGGSIGGSGSGNFTDDTSTATYPGLQTMLDNVQRAAEPNNNKTGPKTIANTAVCGSSDCLGTCMHTMAALWGYPSSGYGSPYQNLDAISMWNALSGTSHEHPGSRNVPVGALLIYSGSPGHVVIYLGHNLIVSTDTGPDGSYVGGGGIHVVSADSIEKKWGMNYIGWADPVFGGHLGYGSVHY